MTMQKLILRLVCAAVLGTPAIGFAQDGRLKQVDRIVAIVGRSVIAYSRVEEELNVFRSQGGDFPADSAGRMALRRDILNRIVEDELLVQAAQLDTLIQINEQDLLTEVEPAIRQVRSQFASEMEYERQLRATGFASQDDYRRWVTDQKRRELTRDMFMGLLSQRGDIEPLPPTEQEMIDFYEEVKDQQAPRPPTVSFRQIVVRTTPDAEERQRTFQLADSLRMQLDEGDADFNELARRFSDDPGSRDQGGEMGWVRRGQGLVPQFEEVAFNIRPGRVVGPVETAYGWHLIEVVRSQPAEVQVRHILIAPEITEADGERARAKAADVAQELRSGVPFDSLASMYHEPMMDRVADDMPLDGLGEEYQAGLRGAQPGDVLGPIMIPMTADLTAWVVMDFMGSRPAGQFTFDDLRDQIRNALSEQNALARYVDELKKHTYVEVRF